jgi:hypothetical protein
VVVSSKYANDENRRLELLEVVVYLVKCVRGCLRGALPNWASFLPPPSRQTLVDDK